MNDGQIQRHTLELRQRQRLAEAEAICSAGLRQVETTPEPAGQKFPRGARVRIAKDLGPMMFHFACDCNATVKFTYAHAFGTMFGTSLENGVKKYCLDVDNYGESSWYEEWQLTLIEDR